MLRRDDLPIENRVQARLVSGYKVDFIGKGILTGLLHTLYPEKYGVWNNSTEKALKKIDVNLGFGSYKMGRTYVEINNTLNKMSEHLGSNMTYIDGFMWYLAK